MPRMIRYGSGLANIMIHQDILGAHKWQILERPTRLHPCERDSFAAPVRPFSAPLSAECPLAAPLGPQHSYEARASPRSAFPASVLQLLPRRARRFSCSARRFCPIPQHPESP